jgi:hypothetical protein
MQFIYPSTFPHKHNILPNRALYIFVRMTRTIVGLYQLNIIDLFLAQVTAQNDNLRVKQGIPCFMRNLASSVDQLHGCWVALRVAQYDCHLNV